jgi:hypothetical protein
VRRDEADDPETMLRFVAVPPIVVAVAAITASAASRPNASATFAVTLTADVTTTLHYIATGARDDGCGYARVGRTFRNTSVATTRPTIIRVHAGRHATYDPARLRPLRVRRREDAGSVVTT